MIKKHINSIPFYSFSAFLFLFPLSERFSTISLLLMGLITILNIKKINLKVLKSFVYILSFYMIYVYLEFLYTGIFFNSNLEQKASLLLFPFFFSTFFFNKKQNDFFIKSLIYGSITSVFVIATKTFFVANLEVFKKTDRAIYNTKDFFFNTFDWQLSLDPLYQSLPYLISFAYIISNKPFNKFVNIILLILLIIGVYFTQSTFGLLTLIILLTYHFLRSKLILFYSSLVVFLIFILKTGLYKHIVETRIVLWQNAIKLINNSFIYGYNSPQKAIDNGLYKVFIASDSIYLNTGLNSHNQYLQLFIDGGILFFIVFLMLFVPLLNKKKFFINKEFYKLTGLVFLLIMLIECIFERYLGIAIFSAFYCLTINYSFTNQKCD